MSRAISIREKKKTKAEAFTLRSLSFRIEKTIIRKKLIHFLPASAIPSDWYAGAPLLFQREAFPNNPDKLT